MSIIRVEWKVFKGKVSEMEGEWRMRKMAKGGCSSGELDRVDLEIVAHMLRRLMIAQGLDIPK